MHLVKEGIMVKRSKLFVSIFAALALALMFMACGGSSSGGGDVTYSGSTDPAVADSTTAATLAEYGMGATEAGFPLAQMFIVPPEVILTGLAAQPQAAYTYTTRLLIPVPAEAVIDGSDYSGGGAGTAELGGTLNLFMGNNISADADTWTIIDVEHVGTIAFDGFRVDEGPALDGTVTVSSGIFIFSGIADYSVYQANFVSDPGFPLWQAVDMTFTNVTLSEGGESWSLGEGDWSMEISLGNWVDIDINSQTVEYDGSTYKVEDTNLYVEFSEMIPAAIPQIVVPVDETSITISGTVSDNGAFYHPVLGLIYFSGSIYEEDPPDEIVSGVLNFYDDPSFSGNLLFSVYFGWDIVVEDTVYNIFMDGYSERGYFVDGTFMQDDTAPWLD
jgi:hypothetical protein